MGQPTGLFSARTMCRSSLRMMSKVVPTVPLATLAAVARWLQRPAAITKDVDRGPLLLSPCLRPETPESGLEAS